MSLHAKADCAVKNKARVRMTTFMATLPTVAPTNFGYLHRHMDVELMALRLWYHNMSLPRILNILNGIRVEANHLPSYLSSYLPPKIKRLHDCAAVEMDGSYEPALDIILKLCNTA